MCSEAVVIAVAALGSACEIGFPVLGLAGCLWYAVDGHKVCGLEEEDEPKDEEDQKRLFETTSFEVTWDDVQRKKWPRAESALFGRTESATRLERSMTGVSMLGTVVQLKELSPPTTRNEENEDPLFICDPVADNNCGISNATDSFNLD
mmetsp:Transcript_39188/g.79892  ORF Transcript_39188/g.79892 Transcript_39188/m.79892 type:complete len:149 (-) Transcript_39188:285-731(-)|eukprot:CAMPEP_0183315408 /NCGR_PEP_ID=MMETSP0160_2-20130417/51679_1 /TAXON_ID=2839 ORGANISM="Odontella Sinensis, Strain Grunow 1884" /NCGR_SAMPLE_ID=MMETSP0160_2 /ASSEMBLY_ACC=CAM_ASM_000250 /LENGTH=148 /DNA_ID=CAMNT_0025480953 /DNA_START=84 /DNA_END=530 /DNA_ORIENTATION=+